MSPTLQTDEKKKERKRRRKEGQCTHGAQHALALPDGAAAAEEADDHDDDADGHEGVGQGVEDVDLLRMVHVIGHVGVHP